jgi:hypothetical protein
MRWVLVVWILAISAGCAQSRTYTPELAPARVELTGLPVSQVRVEVTDLRSEGNGDGFGETVRRQFEGALAKDPGSPAPSKHVLAIDIVEHRSSFTLGKWQASTRLRARLMSPDGKPAGQWEGSGRAEQANQGGYRTARAVSQQSYEAAVADLTSALRGATVQ